MKMSKLNNKYFILFIGFLFSWIISILLFYPQPGGFGWVGTAFSVLIYGFSWIVPITFFTLGFSKGKSKLRKIVYNKIFTILLYTTLIVVLIISWKFMFSNDMIFIGYWTLVTLVWINIYLNLKQKLSSSELNNMEESTTHNNV